MPLTFQQIKEEIISAGIDSRSAENQIDPGFVRDALNAEPVQKHMRKRVGYMGHAGNLPVRVVAIDWDGAEDKICFTLDEAITSSIINLSELRSTPVTVRGRLSSGSNSVFPTTDVVKYYPGFYLELRRDLEVGTHTLTVTGNEHGLGTVNVFMEVAESLDTVTLDNKHVDYNNLSINETNYDISVDYTNETVADIPVFVYYADKDASSGSVYSSQGAGGSQELVALADGATGTITITAIQHGLSNYNIVARLYNDAVGTRSVVEPDSLLIDSITGTLTCTVSNNSGGPLSYFLILSAAPATQALQGQMSGNTYTITIQNPDSPFIFPGIYVNPVGSPTVLEQVIPDEIEYISASDEINVTFTVDHLTPPAFTLFWEYGYLRSTQLCVTDTVVTGTGTDTLPQMTLWGLDHTEIYGNAAGDRAGWTNHIDSYRIAGENRIIAGHSGNLYSAREFSESSVEGLFPELNIRLNNRVSTATVLAPTFWLTGETPGRSRGFITGTGLGDNWATVTSVEYDISVVGATAKYVLTIPSLSVQGTLGTIISTVAGNEDKLDIAGMSNSKHEGSFPIKQATVSGNDLNIWVYNSMLGNSYYDDTGCAGRAGIFTDQIPLQFPTEFIPGDTILSAGIPAAFDMQCINTSESAPTVLVVSGVASTITLSAGLLITGKRTGQVVPLRSGITPSVENVVRGDMLSYYGIDRSIRSLYVFPASGDYSVDITCNGDIATCVLDSPNNTDRLQVGQRILFVRSGVFTGEQVIAEIVDESTFTFASDLPLGTSQTNCVLLSNVVHIDESLEFQDDSANLNLVRVERRWMPIEAPDDSYATTPSTRVRHFETNPIDGQPLIRSAMAGDNMYLTNYDDEVMKFDGVNLYRAGLPNWQPGAFILPDPGATAKIPANLRSISYIGKVNDTGRLEVLKEADLYIFPIGTSIILPGDPDPYIIKSATTADTKHYIYVDRAISSLVIAAPNLISETASYKYYYRITAVDINNNEVASAVSQSQDYVALLSADAAIHHRLIGFPAWDNYDYDALYIQIYRTLKNGEVFYQLPEKIRIDYGTHHNYIEYTDVFRDSDLTNSDRLNVLTGSELGIGWQEPLRARYITTAGNGIILGNIRDYHQLDIQLQGPANITAADLVGHKFRFRRNSNSGTTPITQEMVYEFVNVSTATAITSPDIPYDAQPYNYFRFKNTTINKSVGDWIYLFSATPEHTNLNHVGWWQIAARSGDNYTVFYSGTNAITPSASLKVITVSGTAVPVAIGQDESHGEYAGNSTTIVLAIAAKRLAYAINATMSVISSGGMNIAWMIARGGNDVAVAGRILVRQPRVNEVCYFGWETVATPVYSVFVNNIQIDRYVTTAAADYTLSEAFLFPSRLLVSYPKYAEIFGSPTESRDNESDSAIDVNPSDGQEITGLISFFGESAFGSSQQSGVVVVFKENSIYLVDVNEKRAGNNPVQRIETEGVGCTAPGSITATKNGIMFANESGIYVLRRNLTVEYIGKYMERNWGRVNRALLDQVQGHHFNTGRQYKLSVPVGQDTDNSEVFVYDHSNEGQEGNGGWVRFDNHPSTGWCNLGEQSYFSTTTGRVMIIRDGGDKYDYQDDNQAIDMNIQLRPNDFGLSGIRKVFESATIHYRTPIDSTGTEVAFSIDNQAEYETSTNFRITAGLASSGVSDTIHRDIVSVRHSVNRRRGLYLSVEISNNVRYETTEIAGVEYRVASLGKSAAKDAKGT